MSAAVVPGLSTTLVLVQSQLSRNFGTSWNFRLARLDFSSFGYPSYDIAHSFSAKRELILDSVCFLFYNL